VGGSTVYRTERRFVLGNLELALREEPRPGAERKLSGKEEALSVATALFKPTRGLHALKTLSIGWAGRSDKNGRKISDPAHQRAWSSPRGRAMRDN
jgi:hypothetical protein